MARMGEAIPSEPIRSLVFDYLNATDMTWEVLAEKAGMPLKSLETFLTQTSRKTLSFSTADALLCAMGKPMAWSSPELADIYKGVQFHLKPWEVELLEAAGEPVTCYKGHAKARQSDGTYICRACQSERAKTPEARARKNERRRELRAAERLAA